MKSTHRQSSQRRHGFTLVELMIVIVMMAILSALIVPEMKGTLEGELLHSTSRKLMQATGIAYRQSVTSNQPHRLRVDTSRGRFQIERRATSDESPTGFVPLEGVTGAKGKLDRRIQIEIAEVTEESDEEVVEMESADAPEERGKVSDAILFKPDGTAEKREIRLRDRQGFGVALRLNPITSRVKLVKLERK